MTLIEPAILIAVIIGIGQVLKTIGLESKWMPLVAIALGLILNFGGKFVGAAGWELAVSGIVLGLTACGLYDIKGLRG